jgi:hypothetical protein
MNMALLVSVGPDGGLRSPARVSEAADKMITEKSNLTLMAILSMVSSPYYNIGINIPGILRYQQGVVSPHENIDTKTLELQCKNKACGV